MVFRSDLDARLFLDGHLPLIDVLQLADEPPQVLPPLPLLA